jgi:hypothetical protein
MDFMNLNRASLKYDYPIPKMNQMLQKVVGSERISMLDGFSKCNQVLVPLGDKMKMHFTAPWGTFMYLRMPFGIINNEATF